VRHPGDKLKDPIWERQSFESERQWKAFSDFLTLPVTTRTIAALLKFYVKLAENNEEYVPPFIVTGNKTPNRDAAYIPPTTSIGTLNKWSSICSWFERSSAYETNLRERTSIRRAEEQERRIENNVRSELDQVEEFRNSMVVIGRSMVSYGSYIMKLLDTTTRVYPLGSALDDRAIAKLKDVAFIYRACVTDGIPKGQDVWAQGLGIQEAIDIIGKDVSENEAA
jgi:hypothetical protein